jgi:tetratricopeptide (TPR) repeat protein
VGDTPRIEELRRRIQKDPASIAFAQLAEEHRRMGEFEEAVRVARAGLEQHPAYLSARVTLGRALLELGRFDEAQGEFEHVLLGAPDNLMALRSMAELHQRRETAPIDFTPHAPMPLPETPPTPVTQPTAAIETIQEAQTTQATQSTSLSELEGWLAAIRADRAARA